ncbi:ParA family protein [Aestuariispira insulae]|uniref:Cellulose biosynthesis protein BcsQ n=1 Tax=Aestuariispira insulae TaxID=1461337 RepID=A0A3D9H8I2_9PROT|nr:AAA family ATPase [Aestuariispira insulae]RED45798.1 cellulose biosynthesis protein BcsQ [Aestuariispira insulae]
MKVISIYNMKGGVGKTATAVNLSYQAAQSGLRTLIWDLDPQGATSFYFRVKPKVKGGGKKIVKGKSDLDDLIKGTDYTNLDLLPADFSYRDLDLRFADEKDSRLKKLITPLKKEYDLIVFDCPPSISELSQQIFRASDMLIVPMLPTTLSIRTLDQIRLFLKEEKIKGLKLRTFFSMVDRRKKMHKDIIEEFAAKGKGHIEANIPYASAVEKMGIERAPVGDFAPRTAPALSYRELWREINKELD